MVGAGLVAGARAGRRWPTHRVVVRGESMRPAVEPGDRLLVVGGLRPRVGDVVALVDPEGGDRPVLKRVAAVEGDRVVVQGDRASLSVDSRHYGAVTLASVRGKVVYRYAPPERAGRLR